MKISRSSVSLGVVALLIAGGAGLPALGQDSPESILPPGFNEPLPTPVPTPARSGVPAPALPGVPSGAVPTSPALSAPTPSPTPSATPTPIDLSRYELPEAAKRSLAQVGIASGDSGLLAPDAFGTASGRMLETLMRRLDAPLPSRWLSIALRRALVSRVNTPRGVNGADFAAERAWLLLRMGESDSARAVVQSVDVANYTPKLYQVAMQAMLANGDPAGLCPLVEGGSRVSTDAAWTLASAMCAGLSAEPTAAGAQLDRIRRRMGRGIDYLLAEKVVGAGAGGRRAVTIEWGGVDRLTAWRYGLATATGVEIPSDLLSGARPAVSGWLATSPMIDAGRRAASSEFAATQGILSNLALTDLFGEIEASDDANSAEATIARDLRSAFSEGTETQRLTTLKALWGNAPGASGQDRTRFARMVLTARAAARIQPRAEYVEDSSALIASMLTAGLDRTAVAWRNVVPEGSDGWAMLALAEPAGRRVSGDAVETYAGQGGALGRLRGRMLLAGLTALGRVAPEDAEALAQPLDVKFGAQNAWTRAIDAAAGRGEPATVLLLVAVGMQTEHWRGVPPEALYHAVSALRSVGLDGEARMIAAEAIARI